MVLYAAPGLLSHGLGAVLPSQDRVEDMLPWAPEGKNAEAERLKILKQPCNLTPAPLSYSLRAFLLTQEPGRRHVDLCSGGRPTFLGPSFEL